MTLVAEVERRGAEANKKPQGADYPSIIRDVANENGISYSALKAQCKQEWTRGIAG